MNQQNGQIASKCIQAQRLKEQGNLWFKNKQYVKALRSYHQANLYLTGLIDKQSPMATYSKQLLNQQQSKKVNQLKFSIFMNMSQIYIFQNKYEKARDILIQAQQIKTNTKLKYRLAIVYMNIKQIEKSKVLFNQAFAEDPSLNTEVNQHLLRIKEIQKQQDRKSKKMYAKFFQSRSQK